MNWLRCSLALAIKLCIEAPMWIAGWLAFPFAYPFRTATSDITHFPRWAWPWDNADHGIDGQKFYAEKTVGYPYWLRCLLWSCARNGTFNWSKYVMGIRARLYRHEGDNGIGDKKKSGAYWNFAGPFFEYYRISPYRLFKWRLCVRIRFGWKLQDKKAGEVCQFCFVAWPFMPYSGK